MEFNFHGENSLSEAVLMKGQAATLAYDPGSALKPGMRIKGILPASAPSFSAQQPDSTPS